MPWPSIIRRMSWISSQITPKSMASCFQVETLVTAVSELVGALTLSPVNHKGLQQGWTQTSLYIQVIHFTRHHTTSHIFSAYLYSTGTQHGNLHPAGWPILFCGHTQEPGLATANTGKKNGRGSGKNAGEWTSTGMTWNCCHVHQPNLQCMVITPLHVLLMAFHECQSTHFSTRGRGSCPTFCWWSWRPMSDGLVKRTTSVVS